MTGQGGQARAVGLQRFLDVAGAAVRASARAGSAAERAAGTVLERCEARVGGVTRVGGGQRLPAENIEEMAKKLEQELLG